MTEGLRLLCWTYILLNIIVLLAATSSRNCSKDSNKNSKEFERRDVPQNIEPLDISNFEVFDPFHRYQEEEPPVPFIVYRKSDPDQGLDAKTVEFMKTEKVVIYLHGYATTMLDDGMNIKDAVFAGTWDVDSVIIVDWREWSLTSEGSGLFNPSDYITVALYNVPIVTERVHEFLLTKLHNDNYIYIVGFSLGGQIAGTASRKLAKDGLIIDRISALDPAGPIFEYTLNIFPLDTTNTLRMSDATFVDVIHCSTVLGMEKPAGHLDTYLDENYCFLPSCTHRRAILLYISSLKRCSLITCPMSGESCSPLTVSAYGYLSDKYPGRGEYELSVITDWWYWGDDECSEFMNVYLPAKRRVCFEPPTNGNGECNGQPFLTECPSTCPVQKAISSSVCSTHSNVRLEYEDASENHVRSLEVASREPDKVNWHGGDCM